MKRIEDMMEIFLQEIKKEVIQLSSHTPTRNIHIPSSFLLKYYYYEQKI